MLHLEQKVWSSNPELIKSPTHCQQLAATANLTFDPGISHGMGIWALHFVMKLKRVFSKQVK